VKLQPASSILNTPAENGLTHFLLVHPPGVHQHEFIVCNKTVAYDSLNYIVLFVFEYSSRYL